MTSSASNSSATSFPKILLYLVLAGLGVSLLVVLYFGLSYLGANLFLTLDNAPPGRLGPYPWVGYALLGLALGAAAGARAAHRRFRLGLPVQAGAAVLTLAAGASLVIGNTTGFVPLVLPPVMAEAYAPDPGQGQCPACAAAVVSSTRPSPTNRYTAQKLLDKNPATAWIADSTATAAPAVITLTLTIPPNERLLGLRLTNGYAKTAQTFASFARVRACRAALDGSPAGRYTLPDQYDTDYFLPLEASASSTPLQVRFEVEATYPGLNHPEVALSGLVPVITVAAGN